MLRATQLEPDVRALAPAATLTVSSGDREPEVPPQDLGGERQLVGQEEGSPRPCGRLGPRRQPGRTQDAEIGFGKNQHWFSLSMLPHDQNITHKK